MVKFKTKAKLVEAFRITDPNVGQVGSWLIMDGASQKVISNVDFVVQYGPAGRGQSKAAYEAAKAELPQVKTEAKAEPASAST